MQHLEDNLQMACVRWFKCQYPNILIHHSPNGGKRNAREGARFKAMGTVPGFPDIFIPYPNKFYHGLFLELKSENGVISKNQKQVLAFLGANLYYIFVCRSLEDFINTVTNYLKKTNLQ